MRRTGLPFARLFGLAWRQSLRELRAGEIRMLCLALVVAVAASVAIGYFTARLGAGMENRASEFLAADLVLLGSEPPRPEQVDAGLQRGLEHSRSLNFSTMAAGAEALQLASVKAVQANFPLRGEVRSAAAPDAPDQPGGAPAPGEAWVEPRLLLALDAKVGDRLDIGRKALTITRVLTYEPDRAGDFYSLTPRVLINLDDVAATGVIQPGSRVRYRELWRGEPQALAAYRQALTPALAANQRFEGPGDGNRQLGNALERAQRYLGLASLVAVVLAGVAVALSANRFAARRFDASALLRCLGLTRRDALVLYGLQLGLLGLAASLLGALLGWLAQLVLFELLHGLLPARLPAVGIGPALAGMGTGLVALVGFALPPLAALGRVPPLRVLRSDLQPVPLRTWLVYGCALLALGLIMWRLSLDLRLTLALLVGGLVAGLLFGSLLYLALRGLRRAMQGAPLAWRLGLGQLLRHPLAAVGQTLAFGLILLAMSLVVLLRGELLERWQAQLPAEAPNHFALNVLPDERQAFAAAVAGLSPHASPLYPIVQGRLVSVKGHPAQEGLEDDSRGGRATRRDLNLTWSAGLPDGNRLEGGQWWDALPAGDLPGVSLESELARSLGVGLGDTLGFVIGDRQIEARVTSLRQVSWDNFQPNFFVIFAPGALQDVPFTYLGSFYLPPGHDRELLALARQFPAVTLLPIDALLDQLRSILRQVSVAVEFVLLFVLAAGIAVLLAGLQATLDERIRQGALLRALGARRELLQRARRTEFILLGGASGLLAALGCEIVSALLYRLAFDLDWQPHPWLLLLPVLGALLVGAAGLLGTRRALTASPLLILRES
ncbi:MULTISPECIES: ABC transporter permease [Pseudomonas]|uniref:ABC transporter permease n=1 Tax=Pseudomonas TaxID=286 RepID=UPI001D715787|nr:MULTISPECIES: FtsX-like permease family protein [Pseudomonas]HJE68506.1 ABC transporter permease [Pseudomonas oryzihabitans]